MEIDKVKQIDSNWLKELTEDDYDLCIDFIKSILVGDFYKYKEYEEIVGKKEMIRLNFLCGRLSIKQRDNEEYSTLYDRYKTHIKGFKRYR